MKSFLYKLIKIFAVVAFLVQPFATNASSTDWFKGWIWSSNIGWVSLNAVNTGAANDYGVTVNPGSGNSVTGWAWSDNVGWICFGSTCINTNNSALCPTSWTSFLGIASPAAALNTAASPYQLTGWARLQSQDFSTNATLTTAERCDQGWISLNCSNKGTCGTVNYNVNVYSTTGYSLNGYAWSSTTPANYGGLGWIRFDPNYGSGYQVPGVYQGTEAGVPWLQVVYGSLYSKGNVYTFTPFAQTFGTANVAYCIDTGGNATVTNMNNGSCTAAAGVNNINASQNINVNIPRTGTNYSNLFGKIDMVGIHAGRYGTVTALTAAANITGQLPSVLGGNIYETPTGTTTYTMSAQTFNNASGGQNGSGLIIVHGNLNITGPLTYQSGTITKLSQLASVGILVLDDGSGNYGKVTISPTVQTVSANIFAEGRLSTGTTGLASTDVPLTINGVTIADQYYLQRLYTGSPTQGSEEIVYDGRVIANTPPGMSDIVKSLPIVSN
jgi:hypothetical protein